jgi:hypothetical protein
MMMVTAILLDYMTTMKSMIKTLMLIFLDVET